jgi:hypothetical protein
MSQWGMETEGHHGDDWPPSVHEVRHIDIAGTSITIHGQHVTCQWQGWRARMWTISFFYALYGLFYGFLLVNRDVAITFGTRLTIRHIHPYHEVLCIMIVASSALAAVGTRQSWGRRRYVFDIAHGTVARDGGPVLSFTSATRISVSERRRLHMVWFNVDVGEVSDGTSRRRLDDWVKPPPRLGMYRTFADAQAVAKTVADATGLPLRRGR